jgi:hypothetical protein
MMVNRNHFQFDRKSLFNGFENRKLFSKFKLSILTRTFVGIRYHGASKFVGSPNLLPKVSEFWYPIAGIRWHMLDSGDITGI